MSTPAVTNWFGDLVSHPQVVVEANSTADIIAILKDPVKYPSPVRAIGSNHSTSPCGVVEGGTLIMMSKMHQRRVGRSACGELTSWPQQGKLAA